MSLAIRVGLLAVAAGLGYLGCNSEDKKPVEPVPPKPEVPQDSPPVFNSKSLQLNSPCGVGSDVIDLRPAYEKGKFIAVCTSGAFGGGQVFGWDPDNKMWQSPLTSRNGTAPEQVIQLRSNALLANTLNIANMSPATAGFLIYNKGFQSTVEPQAIPLPEVDISALERLGSGIAQTSKGNSLRTLPGYVDGKYRLPFLKGMVRVEINGKESVFTAASGIDDVGNKTNRTPDYLPGGLFEYQTDSGKFDFYPIVVTDSSTGKNKQYFNPTSLGVASDGKIVIAASGAIQHSLQGKSVSQSAVVIFDPQSRRFIKAFEQNHAIGFSGKVAISPDGLKAAFPTGDSSKTVVIVDLQNGSKEDVILPVSSDRSFFSDIQIIGNLQSGYYVVATDIHSGEVFSINLATKEKKKMITVAEEGMGEQLFVGATFLHGNSLYAGVGSHLYRLDR